MKNNNIETTKLLERIDTKVFFYDCWSYVIFNVFSI